MSLLIDALISAKWLLVTAIIAYLFQYVFSFLTEWVRRFKLIELIPGPKKFSPVLGNIPVEVITKLGTNTEETKEYFYNLMQAINGYTQMYDRERIYRLWLGLEPWIFLWKPESVESVLSNNFLLEKSTQYDFLHPWLGTGLLTSGGSKWKTRRKMLSPAFHFKILHDFVPVFNEHSAFLVNKLKKDAMEGHVFDIVPVITACTLDVICETIMGVKINAQSNPNNDYCKAVNEVGECWLERLIQPTFWLDSFYYQTMSGKRFASSLKHLHDFTRKVIRDRKQEMTDQMTPESNKTKAFLDLLLNQHLNGGDMSEEDIREEVDTFMFEGHDTTAMALSWIIYLLGHNRHLQEKVWLEIDQLFEEMKSDGEEHIPLHKIKDLKYLDCIVKEGLRLCPSVPVIGRKLNQDFPVKAGDKEYMVPTGTIVYVFIYMLHRDPETFPNPEVFDPDRFLNPESGRNPFSLVPFSAGPRNCIGQRFALTELKTILAFFLRNFIIHSMDARDKILVNMEMVLRPKTPLRIRLEQRNHE